MLVPRDLDPAAAAAQIPLPPVRPPRVANGPTKIPPQKSSDVASLRQPIVATPRWLAVRKSSTPGKLIVVRKSATNISITPMQPR
jgi:hypothetical protein